MIDERVSISRQAPPAGVWSPSYRLLTVGLIATVAGTAFEALAVATTLPATVKDLGGLAMYGWAFSAFMLTNLIGITIAGDEADRHGPARPFIVGVALFVLGLFIAGFTPTMSILIFGRAIQGFGAGSISSVAYVAIGRAYSEAAKPKMLALMSSAWVVPGLIGPALAGIISDHFGWRWVFLGLAPLFLLAAAVALPALRHFEGSGQNDRDWRRILTAVCMAAGTGIALGGLSAHNLLFAGLLFIVGCAIGLPALRHLLPAGTLTSQRGLPAAIATIGLVNFAFFGVDAFVPLMVTGVRGRSATIAGLAVTAATIGWTIGAWVQARLAAQQSRRLLVLSGLAILATGVALTMTGLIHTVPVMVIPATWGFAGLGMGIAFSTLTLVVLESAPPGAEGATSAAMQLMNGLGIALGAGLGGAIIAYISAHNGSLGTAIAIQDPLMIALFLLAMFTATRMPRRPPSAQGQPSIEQEQYAEVA